MSEVREALTAALQSLVGVACSATLATNSIKFSFDFQNSPNGRAYIWIDPPWRLTLRGTYITGSYDWPVWDGKANREVNEPLWHAWCDLFDELRSTQLARFSIANEFPDLRLHFESGHTIETFGNKGSDYWWYFRNRVTGEVFEATANGILHEFGEPASSS